MPTGGGLPNSFGQAFKRHDFKWTKALCEEDSDGDGLTNGHELGDPCCIWTPGEQPSRTYAISHPGDIHSSTMEPMPLSCDKPLQDVDIVASGDEQFYKFYYTSAQDLKTKSDSVKALYHKMDLIANKSKNYCGGVSELSVARHKGRPELSSEADAFCGVCSKCCGGEFAEDQQKCDACVDQRCRKVKPGENICPMTFGKYQKFCECKRGPSIQDPVNDVDPDEDCLLTCVCKDAFGLPIHSVCNLRYCPATRGMWVEVENQYGYISCPGGMDFCRATYNYSGLAYRMSPPSAYQPSWYNIEGALARIFGSYKASNEIAGDANKVVANFYASLFVFGMCFAIVYVDFRWMVSAAFSVQNLGLLLLATCYIDLFSGLLHVCLDNPNFVNMPLIGPQCQSFQTHHDSPTRMVQVPWFGYLSEHHAMVAVVLLCGLGNRKNRPLRVFLLYSAIMSDLMMASHRWSHVHPSKVPAVVSTLSKMGILMPIKMHSYHHVTYDCNFCIFTGWFNPLLNLCTKVVHPYSRVWLVALFAYCFVPLAVSFDSSRAILRRLFFKFLNKKEFNVVSCSMSDKAV